LLFRISVAAAIAVAGALLPGAAVVNAKPQAELVGTVGPGFTISLRTTGGEVVRHLDAGTHTITVNDQSVEHNFHLRGPGVDRATDVEFVGTQTWTVTVTDGTYRYQCDPHSSQMNGTFTAGNVQPPPPTPPPPAVRRLNASVGPGYTISLKTTAGKRATRVKAGRYRITVRDRSKIHNFHLRGSGVNKTTGVGFKGTKVWTVRLQKGKIYRFRCDPHASRMKGTVRAT
jgi:plastocyanin